MSTQTPEEKLAYVFTCLKHAALPRPDYNAVAKETGVNNANNAQKKFKAIVEAAGFKLVDCQIVGADGSAGSKGTGVTPVTPSKRAAATPKKTPAKKAATSKAKASGGRGKKRKVDEVNEEDHSAEEEQQVKGEGGENNDDDIEMNGDDEKNGDRVRSTSVQADYEEAGADEDED